MKKSDYKLIGMILAAALILFFAFRILRNQDAGMVEITVDGRPIGTYRLDREREIDINGTNILVIRNGSADMTEADCPDRLCVNQKAVSKNGESIVCLPNRIIVTVIEGSSAETDSVSG